MPHLSIEWVAALLFAAALLHTFCTNAFERLALRHPRHAGLFHLLGEVEVVFGFWAIVLVAAMALIEGGDRALDYAGSRQYTEPFFVFVVMVIAASRPIVSLVISCSDALARAMPWRAPMTKAWMGLCVIPLLGSLITEPAAMTIAALTLLPIVFRKEIPERLKYFALGVLFVNVSIGGTLSAFAAPPVLMVAAPWGWDSVFMMKTFGWKAAIAVLINASVAVYFLRAHIGGITQPEAPEAPESPPRIPLSLTLMHLALLAAVVALAHHPVAFLGLFLLFVGLAQAYERYQSPLIIREALLVGFFLAGLVVLGGLQQWWLQPLMSGRSPAELYLGATVLTAFTDNAALTYLGTLVPDLSEQGRYSLVAGAVAGGGLSVIANAPNPAGVALLRAGFAGASVGAGSLLLGALPPTLVALLALGIL